MFTVCVQVYSQAKVTKCGIYTLVCFGEFLLVQIFVNFIIEQGAFIKFGSMALPYIFFTGLRALMLGRLILVPCENFLNLCTYYGCQF